jgi:ferredoxin
MDASLERQSGVSGKLGSAKMPGLERSVAVLITIKKPFSEVREALAAYHAVGILGCADCASVCQTGGSEQIKEMAQGLEDKEIVFSLSCEAPCDQRVARRDLRRVARLLAEAEAVVMLTCGIGVQSVGRLTDKILIPGLNTVFPGSAARIGEFYEYCQACGDCLLMETAGLCPHTLCPKGLVNGPCEGLEDGKCEAWGFERDCVWCQIYERLRNQGRPARFSTIRPATDWAARKNPRQLLVAR